MLVLESFLNIYNPDPSKLIENGKISISDLLYLFDNLSWSRYWGRHFGVLPNPPKGANFSVPASSFYFLFEGEWHSLLPGPLPQPFALPDCRVQDPKWGVPHETRTHPMGLVSISQCGKKENSLSLKKYFVKSLVKSLVRTESQHPRIFGENMCFFFIIIT